MESTIVKINSPDLPIKEYNGQRVVTMKDIDTLHGKASGTARKRFSDNKKALYRGDRLLQNIGVRISDGVRRNGLAPTNGYYTHHRIRLSDVGEVLHGRSRLDGTAVFTEMTAALPL